MGGMNSGRSSRPRAWRSKKPMVGSLSGLKVSEFIKRQTAAPNNSFSFENIQLKLEDSSILLTSDNCKLETCSIQTSSMRCHYGGLRYFGICPLCSKRVTTLFRYKTYFACRHCFQMHYPSQNQPLYYRMILKTEQAHKKINSDEWTKPKWMRQKIFLQLRTEYHNLDEKQQIADFFRCKNLRQVENIFKKYGSAIEAAERWAMAQGF